MTTTLTTGSLFSGYLGLDLGLDLALPNKTRLAWVCDIEPGPAHVLARHHPDVPNLHDVTTVDWTSVEPVDVITGGSPCPDLSKAGNRAGMRPGTRSGLWSAQIDAVRIMRPRLMVWENVEGALNAPAHSALEPCPGCVGDLAGDPPMRALGRVLGDLACIRYDACWVRVRASDVHLCHSRARVFVVAWPSDEPESVGWIGITASGRKRAGRPIALLPTPAVNDMGSNKTPEEWDAWTATMRERHGNGNGHGPSLEIELQRLARKGDGFGRYAAAIGRHRAVVGRPAPEPTEQADEGGPRRSARFVEWMMGLPDGWVTDPDLWDGYLMANGKPATPRHVRNLQLRMLGNGVVPMQAAAAIRWCLAQAAEHTRTA